MKYLNDILVPLFLYHKIINTHLVLKFKLVKTSNRVNTLAIILNIVSLNQNIN